MDKGIKFSFTPPVINEIVCKEGSTQIADVMTHNKKN